ILKSKRLIWDNDKPSPLPFARGGLGWGKWFDRLTMNGKKNRSSRAKSRDLPLPCPLLTKEGKYFHMNALPIVLGALCFFAIAYRYYSGFIAAKVLALDDSRETPAHTYFDGQNYYPMSKWVLFGHHFAAITGAGPLIGPVLAAQFGFLPGLIWLVLGVVLAGAVPDLIILFASVRPAAKSPPQISPNQ